MLFNSLTYAIFLPLVFILYWNLPYKYRWILLLISSYYFYMSWSIKYVGLIVFTTAVSFFSAILIDNSKNENVRKTLLIMSILLCVSVLFVFKYFNFVSTSVAQIIGLFTLQPNPITLKLLLPVGISFYTFQTIGYVIDVYSKNVRAEHNFGVYATFVSFFPQLVAGPIERTNNLLPQIKSEKKFDYYQAMYGARLILWGLFKKIAVADFVSVYVDRVYYNLNSCVGADWLVAVFFFTVQIYCDFSGYSDIAIGSAKVLGIELMTNFRSPYFSTSVREFWSKWHISLSTWFRDYIYIPLGGNRCSKFKNYRNIMITFLISGLWHGANWTFVIWGGMHGLMQIFEKILRIDKLKNTRMQRLLSWIIFFLFCNYAWVLFRAECLRDACVVIVNTFSHLPDWRWYLHNSIGLDGKSCLYAILSIGIIGVFDYYSLEHDVFDELTRLHGWKIALRVVAEYILIGLMVYSLWSGVDTNQFVYFQF